MVRGLRYTREKKTMKYFLFTDDEFFNREIYANSFNGALLKAKSAFGIRVPMRCIETIGNAKAYKSIGTGYWCELKLV